MSDEFVCNIHNFKSKSNQKISDVNKEYIYSEEDAKKFLEIGFSLLILARKINTTEISDHSKKLFETIINFIHNQTVSNHLRVALFCVGFEYLLHTLFLKEGTRIQNENKGVFNLREYCDGKKYENSKINSLKLNNKKKKYLWLATKKVAELRGTFLHKINKGSEYTENITWNVIDKGLHVLWEAFEELKDLDFSVSYKDVITQGGF